MEVGEARPVRGGERGGKGWRRQGREGREELKYASQAQVL